MALSILIADSDEEWLDAACKFLKENLYLVKPVTNGKDAQLALYNDKYFAVVMNYDIEKHSGVQVMKFIKANYPSQRVLLLINSKKRMDELGEERINRLGVLETLVRPFELAELKMALEGHQSLGDLISSLPKREGVSDEVEVKASEDDFSEIKITDFHSSKAVLFDVFIKLGGGRFVKILHAGDQFSKERLDRYKVDKKIEHLYFHVKDRRKFIQFNNHLAKKFIANARVPAQTKVSLLQNVSQKFVEEVFSQGVKPQVLDQGKDVCENIYNLVEKQEDLYLLLRDFQDFDPNAFTHAFLTSLFTTAIIKQFEWQSKVTIETTALACLFHDIGKTKLPPEYIGLRPKDMSEDQLKLYQEHPKMGVEIIEGNRMINNSVKQIILQHHEAYDGTGFPFQKRGSKILTLANIVALANDFVHIIMEDDIKPVLALRKMLGDKIVIARYNSTIVEKFINVFVDPGKIVKEQQVLPSNSRVVPNKKAS